MPWLTKGVLLQSACKRTCGSLHGSEFRHNLGRTTACLQLGWRDQRLSTRAWGLHFAWDCARVQIPLIRNWPPFPSTAAWICMTKAHFTSFFLKSERHPPSPIPIPQAICPIPKPATHPHPPSRPATLWANSSSSCRATRHPRSMQVPTASRHRWVMCPTPQLGGERKTWGDDGKWLWINTYENTILSGMNIHKSQLFWCEQKGYYWFWPIPKSWLMDKTKINGPKRRVVCLWIIIKLLWI